MFMWYTTWMHNIHDIKSIFSQNVMLKGYLKYKIINYKPTKKMTCVMWALGNDFYLGTPSSLDHVFTDSDSVKSFKI
jgi:hypothetical protein